MFDGRNSAILTEKEKKFGTRSQANQNQLLAVSLQR
jgi:hypothetical protein